MYTHFSLTANDKVKIYQNNVAENLRGHETALNTTASR